MWFTNRGLQLPKLVQTIIDASTDTLSQFIPNGNIKHSDRAYAPVWYSQMANVVSEIKSDKIGAASVVPYLKGHGVKDDEIKWSGIIPVERCTIWGGSFRLCLRNRQMLQRG